MIALIEMILPFSIKMITMWVTRKQAKDEEAKKARQRWDDFLIAIEPTFTDSARLRKSVQDQRSELLKRFESE